LLLKETRRIAVVAMAVVWLGGSTRISTHSGLRPAADREPAVTGSLEPGERFDKTFDLTDGRYLELAAKQLEGNVALRLLGPSGETLAVSEFPGRPWQEEIVAVVTSVAGPYTARVELESSAIAPARFELRTVARRRATRRDRSRVEGLRLFHEAMSLKQEETEASSRQAVDGFEHAAAIFADERQALWQGRALQEIAATVQQLGEVARARESFARSVSVLREADERAALSEALSSYGSLLADLGEVDRGLQLCREALALSRELGARDLEATSLNNLAVIRFGRERPEDVVESFEEIVVLRRQLGDREELALSLSNMGVVYRILGRTEGALDAYNEALELALDLGQDGKVVNTLYNNLGVLYRARGEVRRAIDAYESARELAERRGDLDSALAAGYNGGSLYRKLGEPLRARALLGQALELSRKLESPTEARVLQALGELKADEGDHASALELLAQARLRSEKAGDRTGEAYALYGIGRCRLELENLDAARLAFEHARRIQTELGDRPGLSSTLRFLSIVASQQGDFPRAQALVDEAFLLAEQIGDPGQKASAREQRAVLLASSGHLEQAREELEESIETLESLRSDLVRPDLRATFFARGQERYVRLVSLIHGLDAELPVSPNRGPTAAAEAFEVSERARARSLVERIWESQERLGQDINPGLESARHELLGRLSTSQLQLTRLLQRDDADPMAIEARRVEIGEIYRFIQDIDRELRHSDPRWETLTYPEPVTARTAQALVGAQSAVLSYLLGPDESFLFVLTHRDLEVLPLPGESELLPLVQEMRKLLETPSRRNLGRLTQVSRKLYSILVEPAESLIAGRQHLIVVPDGPLQYLPFESLLASDPLASSPGDLQDAYLIARWGVSYAPSVSVLASLRSRKPVAVEDRIDWVAFADPIIPGAVIPAEGEALVRGLGDQSSWRWRQLAGARAEVRRIEALFGDGEALVFLGDLAGEREFKSESAVGRARYLHFASHALVDSQTPDLSAVLLAPAGDGTEDGLLQTHEILKLDLNAELVVLSGCETALGRQVRGEGLVGFTQAFLFAGARAVAASLWPVEDESTSELMLRFYGGLQSGEEPVEAMRQAKLRQLSNSATAHPYYWAPFVLVGELR
jgi:CHAT domain-containing protein/Tfp pilus assembly protein PilF